MNINRRQFGPTSLNLSRLCLGTSNFARYANQEESFGILDAFRKAGGNFVQTSGICPGINLGDGLLGLPEEVLGRWIRHREIRRDEIVIATRIALTRPVIGRLETFARLIRQCTDDSIRRIGCDYLDLLVVECTDALAPLSESVPALETVAGSESVRHVVPANFPLHFLCEALRHSRRTPRVVAGVQVDYSIAARDAFEGGVARACADNRLGVIARSPLAGGYLANRSPANDASAPHDHRDDSRVAASARASWPQLAETARALGVSPPQVALAWVLAHRPIDSVLVSVRSAGQLRDLIGATSLRLTEADVTRLGSHAAPLEPACNAAADAPARYLPD